MVKRYLTVGYLREIIKNLDDDVSICQLDHDTAHLSCYVEQMQVNGGHLVFVPSECYQLWVEIDEINEEYPIPIEWQDEEL